MTSLHQTIEINQTKEDRVTREVSMGSVEDEEKLEGPLFSPPLYIQRYRYVADTLSAYKAESVLDVGCAECQIMRNLPDVKTLKKIGLLDFDAELLAMCKLRIRAPLYRFVNKRELPLLVQLYHGDATELDSRMLGYDVVTMVEFIEHLFEDDLGKIVKVVFQMLQPRVVIVTTPNFEFNQLFANREMKYRHTDHKFEWTRAEFAEWSSNVCCLYGYNVKYSGVGNGPPDKSHLGFCSQAAIFERKFVNESSKTHNENICHKYTLMAEATYPHVGDQERLSPEVALKMEVDYCIKCMLRREDLEEDTCGGVNVKISDLLNFKSLSNLCNINDLRNHLVQRQFSLTDNETEIIVPLEDYDDDRRSYWDDDDDNNEEEETKDEVKQVMDVTQDTYIYESWD